jgi:hypothetical protein
MWIDDLTALLANIYRIAEDADILLMAGRYASAKALAIVAIEEAGKYTSILSNDLPRKKTKLHLQRQEAIGRFFRSAAMFEACAREMPAFLEGLKLRSSDNFAAAESMTEKELITFAMDALQSDPTFDMDRFLRRVLGEDLSVKFHKLASAGDYHKQRQAALHVDFNENGELLSDPSSVTEEDAREFVELAWFAANLQELWKNSKRPV